MLGLIAAVFGVLVGWSLLLASRPRNRSAGKSSAVATTLGWLTLAFGVAAAAVFAVGFAVVGTGGPLLVVSIALAVTTVVLGAGSWKRGHRRWPTWVGLVVGALLVLFWVVFAAAEILGTRR